MKTITLPVVCLLVLTGVSMATYATTPAPVAQSENTTTAKPQATAPQTETQADKTKENNSQATKTSEDAAKQQPVVSTTVKPAEEDEPVENTRGLPKAFSGDK